MTILQKCFPQGFTAGDIKYVLFGIIHVIIAAYLFFENIYIAFLLSPYIVFYVREKISERCTGEKNTFAMQFSEGMLSVSFALNVGYSIENAFKEALSELILLYGEKALIVNEFKVIVNRINRNENLEEIIWDFADKTEVEDIRYFAEVFRYAKRSGGDLVSIIKNTSFTIQKKAETLKEIETVIAGKKLEQKVMSAIPFGIIIFLKLSAPEFIEPLYGNLVGIVTMTICLLLYCASDYMAKRIVNIEI
ncbi:MAG: type II secretion system F family protein [Lachnospira sp.]